VLDADARIGPNADSTGAAGAKSMFIQIGPVGGEAVHAAKRAALGQDEYIVGNGSSGQSSVHIKNLGLSLITTMSMLMSRGTLNGGRMYQTGTPALKNDWTIVGSSVPQPIIAGSMQGGSALIE
jgi:hypothetical protein